MLDLSLFPDIGMLQALLPIMGIFGFNFGKKKSSSIPQIVQGRGDPNTDLIFNRDETRGFLKPTIDAFGKTIGNAGSAGLFNNFEKLINSINNRQFQPSQNQENLLGNVLARVNNKASVFTGGPATSGAATNATLTPSSNSNRRAAVTTSGRAGSDRVAVSTCAP